MYSYFVTWGLEPLRNNKNNKERGNWQPGIYGQLALLGLTVGYGSVIFFPQQVLLYKAIYLIPYTIVFSVVAIPLFTFLVLMGQYLNVGPIKGFCSLAPILAGVGWGMVSVSAITVIYYNLYLTESLVLFFKYTAYNIGYLSEEDVLNSCIGTKNYTGQHLFKMDEYLFLFGVSWMIVGVVMLHGFQSSKKVILFVNSLPYYLLFVLFILKIVHIYTSTDEQELPKLFNFTWSNLQDKLLWINASKHVLFTLGIGFGGANTLASYNTVRHKFMRDVIFIPLIDVLTSFVCTFLIYEHLLGEEQSLLATLCKFSENMFEERSTVFIYLIFYLIGLACQFAMIETVTTAVMDQCESLRNYQKSVVFCTCLLLAIPGACMVINMEVYDALRLAGDHTLLFFGLLLAMSARFFSSQFQKIKEDLNIEMYSTVELYLNLSWRYISPLFFIVLNTMYYLYGDFTLSWAQSVIAVIPLLLAVCISVSKCWHLEFKNYFRKTKDFEMYSVRRINNRAACNDQMHIINNDGDPPLRPMCNGRVDESALHGVDNHGYETHGDDNSPVSAASESNEQDIHAASSAPGETSGDNHTPSIPVQIRIENSHAILSPVEIPGEDNHASSEPIGIRRDDNRVIPSAPELVQTEDSINTTRL